MSPKEMEEFVVDEIRKRINNSFLGEVVSSKAAHGMEATLRSVLKEMEQTGVIDRPLTEQDVKGICEIMALEWNLKVSTPDVRAICGGLSDHALKAMTAPYEEFGDCENTARFFFLEKLRREDKVVDWSFTWTDPVHRSGDLSIIPKEPIKYVTGLVGVEP